MSKIKKYQGEVKEGSPPPEPSNVTAENAKAIRSAPSSEDNTATKDGAAFLQSFLNATPFMDQFESVANRTFSGKTIEIKVTKLKAIHPRFYKFCVATDSFIRIIVVGALLYLAIQAALKLLS